MSEIFKVQAKSPELKTDFTVAVQIQEYKDQKNVRASYQAQVNIQKMFEKPCWVGKDSFSQYKSSSLEFESGTLSDNPDEWVMPETVEVKLWRPISVIDPDGKNLPSNLKRIFAMVFDIEGNMTSSEVKSRLHGIKALIHSTYSHCAHDQRWRVIIPLHSSITGDQWAVLKEYFQEKFDGRLGDIYSHTPFHWFRFPACPHDTVDQYTVMSLEGKVFDGPWEANKARAALTAKPASRVPRHCPPISDQTAPDEVLLTPVGLPDLHDIDPMDEAQHVIANVMVTSKAISAGAVKTVAEQSQSIDPIKPADSIEPIAPTTADPLSQLAELLKGLPIHQDYALVKSEFMRLSCLLNTQGLIAPAFRPQPKVGKVRGSSVYMDIHRDQVVIDCHWLHCRAESVATRDIELQPLFDLGEPFPHDLARKFAHNKWTKKHRIEQLLELTPRQQCQLATLRDESVKGRLQAALLGVGKGASRIPPKVTALRLKLNEWADRNNGVRKFQKDYENLWLARELLGKAAPTRQIAELFSLISGKKKLDDKTLKGKLATLDKHTSGTK